MKNQIKVLKQVTVKTDVFVDVNLPAYFNDGNTFFKVVDENTVYEVWLWEGIQRAAIDKRTDEFRVSNACSQNPISAIQFMHAAEKATKIIKSTINDLFDDAPVMDLTQEQFELHNGQSGC